MAEEQKLPIPGYEGAVEIGRGGFGVVYRARQIDVQRTVAIKVLTGVFDDHAKVRFDRERDAMGLLSSHPNSVTVHASGFTPDGRPYIVMEHLDGASLADRLARGPMSWQEAVVVGVKLSGALEAAHRAGVLHRDVKPENVLVSAYGEPKLADFGIARLEGGPETRTGSITASLYHAAPEVFEGKRPTYATDVYSLASTVYALITGSAPFARETDESIVPLFARVATEPVPDLRPRGVPDAVCAVLEAGLAKDAAERIASAREFGERLQAAQRELGIEVTPMVGAPRGRAVPPVAPDLTPTPSPVPPPGDRTGRVPPPSTTPGPTPTPTPTPAAPPTPTPVAPAAPTPAPPAPPASPTPDFTPPPVAVPSSPAGPKKAKPVRAMVIGAVGIVLIAAVGGAALIFKGDGEDPTRLATSVAPLFGGCPTPYTALANNPVATRWPPPDNAPLRGRVRTNPNELNGVVVVATNQGAVGGFNADTGAEVFRGRVDGPVVGNPGQNPGPDGAVYLATLAGGLYKIDPAAAPDERVTRILKTDHPLGGVAVQDGRAYVGRMSVEGGLLVVNLGSNPAKVERVIATNGAVFGKPIVDPATKAVYFASVGGEVYRLPLPGTGPVKRYRVTGRVEAGVRVEEGQLIVATTQGVVAALDPDTGKSVWRYPAAGTTPTAGVYLTPDAGAGQVVIASSDCRLSALSREGRLAWHAQFSRPISAAPVIAGPAGPGAVVISADESGCVNVLKLAPDSGGQMVRSNYQAQLPSGERCPRALPDSLSWDGTRILAGTRDGKVVAMTFAPLTIDEIVG